MIIVQRGRDRVTLTAEHESELDEVVERCQQARLLFQEQLGEYGNRQIILVLHQDEEAEGIAAELEEKFDDLLNWFDDDQPFALIGDADRYHPWCAKTVYGRRAQKVLLGLAAEDNSGNPLTVQYGSEWVEEVRNAAAHGEFISSSCGVCLKHLYDDEGKPGVTAWKDEIRKVARGNAFTSDDLWAIKAGTITDLKSEEEYWRALEIVDYNPQSFRILRYEEYGYRPALYCTKVYREDWDRYVRFGDVPFPFQKGAKA